MSRAKRLSRSAAAGALCLGVMACAGDAIVINGGFPTLGQQYVREQLQSAHANGPVLVEVTGAAFGESPDQLAARIADAVSGLPLGVKTEFTSNPEEAGSRNYRVVFGFDVPNTAGAYQVCDPDSYQAEPSPSGPDRLKVAVAFCYGDSAENHLTARRSALASASSPEFSHTMRHVTSDLFSPGIDKRRGGGAPFDSL